MNIASYVIWEWLINQQLNNQFIHVDGKELLAIVRMWEKGTAVAAPLSSGMLLLDEAQEIQSGMNQSMSGFKHHCPVRCCYSKNEAQEIQSGLELV